MVKRTGDGIESLRKRLEEISKLKLKVGFFDQAKYPDGTPVAHVAAIQEYGTNNIPPRPFIRPTVAERRQTWIDQLRTGFAKALEGKIEPRTVLEAVGEGVRGDVRKTISQINTPALAASTIKARRSRKVDPNQSVKPLIDTGKMLDSVEYRVTED